MNINNNILIGIVFVLFLLIIFSFKNSFNENSCGLIQGFWEVSDDFKKTANIDQLMLYFDEGDGYKYNGYIILEVDGDVVYNDVIKFRITPKGYFRPNEYEFEMEKDIKYIPKKSTMEIIPNSVMMEIKCLKDKKLYAKLFKNTQLSAQTLINIENKDQVENL